MNWTIARIRIMFFAFVPEVKSFFLKGLSPWLWERMMLRAFPLLEGPDKARAAP